VVTLISDNINFKTRNIASDRGGQYTAIVG
jgi:hypothetical protein